MTVISADVNKIKTLDTNGKIEALAKLGIATSGAAFNSNPAATIGYLISVTSDYGIDPEATKVIAIDGDELVIYGKTYEAKDRIKAAGFAWMPNAKVWRRKNG
ncbi:MAG: hypothetical protein LBH43_18140 [Treponema sp.]|nr:hypothetical protein [Treponema sp.]